MVSVARKPVVSECDCVQTPGKLNPNSFQICLNLSLSVVAVSNFIDMSGLGRNEVSLFYKLLQRLNEKRSTTTDIPIKFLSLARNSLDRAPYSSLNLIGKTLEYLSLAGNNFAMLNETTLKGRRIS